MPPTAELTLDAIVGAMTPQFDKVNAHLTEVDTKLRTVDELNTRIAALESGAKEHKTTLDDAVREIVDIRDRAKRIAEVQGSDIDLAGIHPAALVDFGGSYRFDTRGHVVPKLSDGVVNFFRDAIGRKVDGYQEFVKKSLNRDVMEMTMFARDTSQLNSAAGTVGGFVVPPQYRPELQKLLTIYGQARKLFRVIPLETDTLTMPALDGEMDVYQVAENGAPTETMPTLALFTLQAAIYGALTHIPMKLIMQSNPAIVQIVVEAIFRAFAKKEDVIGFTAKKTSGAVYGALDTSAWGLPVNGLLWTPSSGNTNSRGNATIVSLPAGKTKVSDATFSDYRAMIDATPTPALDGAAFFLHRTNVSALVGLAQSQPASWITPLIQRPDGSYTLYGYPIIQIEALPKYNATDHIDTPFSAFCNPVHMAIGDMQQPSVAQDASIGFKNGQIWVRGFEIVGFEATVKDAITILQTAHA